MKKQTIIGLTALAAVSAVGLQRAAAPIDEEVTGSYVTEDGKKIEVVGVCSITPDKIDCWDGAGVRSEELNGRVLGYLSRGNGDSVSFRFGKKNRVVVMVSPQDGPSSYLLESGVNLNSMYWGSDTETRAIGVRIEADAADKTIGLVATVPTKPAVANLRLKTGEKMDIDGVGIEVGQIKTTKPPTNRNMYDAYGRQPSPVGSYWSVIMGLKPAEAQSYGLTYSLLDEDLKPIRYVDLKGNPISAVTFLDLGGKPDNGYPGPTGPGAEKKEKPRCAMAQVFPSTVVAGAQAITMNVNPEKVAYLVLTKQKQKRILFKDIPLDPKE